MELCWLHKTSIFLLCVLLNFSLFSSTSASWRRRFRQLGGHVAVANRNGGSVSLINPKTLKVVANYKLPNNGEPMYFAFDERRFELWCGDRKNDRIVVMRLRRKRIRLRGFLPIDKGVFHTMPTQIQARRDDFPVVCTTMNIANATAVHDLRFRMRFPDIPLPAKIRELGGKPHDTTNNGRYGFVTYIGNSDGFGYVASYEFSGFRFGRYRLVKLLRTARDPHIAVRGNSNLVIAAQGEPEKGGQVLFVSIPDLKILSRDDSQPSPHGTIISFDLKHLYITNIANKGVNAVVTYDMRKGTRRSDCPEVTTSNPIPHNPAVSLDGKRLFVTHSGATSNKNSAFDIDSNGCPIPTSEKIISTGLNPFGLIVLPKP